MAQKDVTVSDSQLSQPLHQPNRIEFEKDFSEKDFYVINGRQEGVLAIKSSSKPGKGTESKALYKLDQELNVQWESSFTISPLFRLTAWDYWPGHFYILLSKPAGRLHTEVIIKDISADSGETRDFKFLLPINLDFHYFNLIEDLAIMAGEVNQNPVVLTYDLSKPLDLKPTVSRGVYRFGMTLKGLQIDTHRKRFAVIQSSQAPGGQKTLVVKIFNRRNQFMHQTKIELPLGHNLVDGKVTFYGEDELYILGTYSYKSTNYSHGVFIAKSIGGRQEFIRFFNFSEIHHFLGYLPERKQQRIRHRIERKDKNRKLSKLNYRTLVGDLFMSEEKIILSGESYYVKYSQDSYNSYQAFQPFSGFRYGVPPAASLSSSTYQFLHAFVLAFDRQGNLLWDHSMPIDDVEKRTLQPQTVTTYKETTGEIHYLANNVIFSKIFLENKVLRESVATPIKLFEPFQRTITRKFLPETLEYWVDNSYLSYGEQRVTPRKEENYSHARNVFYINRIDGQLEGIHDEKPNP